MAARRILQEFLKAQGRTAVGASGCSPQAVARQMWAPWMQPYVVRNGFFRRFVAPGSSTHGGQEARISVDEPRIMEKMVDVEECKKKLSGSGRHCMLLEEFLEHCKQVGMAASDSEAEELVKVLDQCGAIILFRNKVFIHPGQVAECLAKVVPVPLSPENNPRREELARMVKEKAEIDRITHKRVRGWLWTGIAGFTLQTVAFFRLTFWELSWDVMEPVTYYVTSAALITGYLFFLGTSRDPSYGDFMKAIFSSIQKRVIKRRKFDMEKYKELQTVCSNSWRSPAN